MKCKPSTAQAAVCAVVMFVLYPATVLFAGQPYEFVVDLDRVTGISASTLNEREFPADAFGNNQITDKARVHTDKDGHFYTVGSDLQPRTADDRRIRFWGVNLDVNTTFLTAGDAEKVASRLEKMGVNLVRLHSLERSGYVVDNDSNPNNNGPYNSLLSAASVVPPADTSYDGSPDNLFYPELNPDNANALDRLINTFKRHGIYVEIALRTGYEFQAGCYTNARYGQQCVPAPSLAMPTGNRPLDHFNRQMIELQKWYISELMNHINGETGIAYKDDPGIAFLEINNESSLLDYYRKNEADFLTTFRSPYVEEFEQRWNDWLRTEYSKPERLGNYATPTDALRAAWAPANGGGGDIVRVGDFEATSQIPNPLSYPHWVVQNSTHSDPGCQQGNWATGQLVDAAGGGKELQVTLLDKPCQNRQYLLQIQQLFLGTDGVYPTYSGPGLQTNQAYEISFNVRTDSPINHNIGVGVRDNATAVQLMPVVYRTVTTDGSVPLTFCFQSGATTKNAMLQFLPFVASDAVESQLINTHVYIDNVKVIPVPGTGLPDGQGLRESDDPVSRPPRDVTGSTCPPTAAWERDYLQFFHDTDANYFREMRDHLKSTIQVRQPVTSTDATYGGLLGNRIAGTDMDFVDAHFYWDNVRKQPASGNVPEYYWIYNKPMVNTPLDSLVGHIATTRVTGKPFTITEYGMPSANEYAEEAPVIAASYAALQDIDAVILFTYHTLGSGYDPRTILTLDAGVTPWLPTYHNTLRETRRESLMHLSANIFRRGDVATAASLVNVRLNDDMAYRQGGWENSYGTRSIQTWLQQPANILGGNGIQFDARMGLISRIGLTHVGNMPSVTQDSFWAPASPHASDTGELVWTESGAPQSSYVTVNAPRTKAVTGYLGGRSVGLGGVTFTGGSDPSQFGTVSLTSMDNDGQPLATSKTFMLTSIGEARNSSFYRQPRPDGQAGFQLCSDGTFGVCHINNLWQPYTGPVVVQPNPVTIDILGAATTLTVEMLDQAGAVKGGITPTPIPGAYGYRITIGDNTQTPWYQIRAELPTPYDLEAEDGVITPVGSNGKVIDNGASNGEYVALRVNGDVTLTVPDQVPPANYYVALQARAIEYQGPAVAQISAGATSTTLRIPETLGSSWQGFLVSETPIQLGGSGNRTLRFEFTNDAVGADGDRDLHLDVVRLYRAGTQPHNSADLSLTLTDTPDPVMLSQAVTYTTTVTNNGPSTASNVTATGTLPTCNFGTLASGASASCTATVTPNSVGTLNQSMSVSGVEFDPNGSNNTATATTTVNAPDLLPTALSASKSGAKVIISDTVKNQGNGNAGGFTVAYYLSTNTTYEPGTDLPLASSSGGSGICTRTVTSLAPGLSNSIANKTCYKPTGVVTGTRYYVLVVDDSISAVVESSETNNAQTTSGQMWW